MPDWNDLRYFLAVSREGTLAGAARGLAVDASTVGRRLAALEEGLGTKLFDRTPGRWLPTEAGRGILATVEQMEAAALAVERRASGEDTRLEGVVRITLTEAFAVGLVLPRLAPLRERHPGIEVRLLTDYGALDLARREADVAIRLTRPRGDLLVARKAGEIAIAPYVSLAYLERHGMPDLEQGLAGHAVIGYVDEAEKWPEARWWTERAPRARGAVRCNSVLSVVHATRAGLGVGLMPCLSGDLEPELRRVAPPVAELRRDIWLVVHPDLQHNARVRAVLQFLSEIIEDGRALLSGQTRPPAPPLTPESAPRGKRGPASAGRAARAPRSPGR